MSARELEEVYVSSKKVHCDGGNGELGHPKIYMTMAADKDNIMCPYCSKQFIYREKQSKKN